MTFFWINADFSLLSFIFEGNFFIIFFGLIVVTMRGTDLAFCVPFLCIENIEVSVVCCFVSLSPVLSWSFAGCPCVLRLYCIYVQWCVKIIKIIITAAYSSMVIKISSDQFSLFCWPSRMLLPVLVTIYWLIMKFCRLPWCVMTWTFAFLYNNVSRLLKLLSWLLTAQSSSNFQILR